MPADSGSIDSRRKSFLDIGGPNSITNFASSLQRAHIYMEQAINEESGLFGSPNSTDLSPCTSPRVVIGNSGSQSLLGDGHNAHGYGSAHHTRQMTCDDPFHNFDFPHDELAADSIGLTLVPVRSRRESLSSAVVGFGSSTAPQTIFNSVNTLMGVAMLSLPFAFRITGWVVALVQLLLVAWVTSKTAKILGSILQKNKHLHSYGDIAYAFGGSKFHAFATFTFTVDLLGALLSLVLIFADSFSILFPQVNSLVFKLCIVVITFCTSFLPLSTVSFISLVGVISSAAVLVCILICGFLSSTSPGSLISPAKTSIWPSSFSDILLSLGLFMSPWGGHPVFPELYRDMRHPRKFNFCCNASFLFTFILDFAIGAAGYLMFGSNAKDSLTKNLMSNPAYPAWISPTFCFLLALLLASKLALVSRPVITVAERLLPKTEQKFITYQNGKKVQNFLPSAVMARVLVLGLLFGMSVLFTSFGQIMAFFGSAICFTICVTLPLMFHLKLNKEELTIYGKAWLLIGIFFGIFGAVAGTYASIVSTVS